MWSSTNKTYQISLFIPHFLVFGVGGFLENMEKDYVGSG